MHHDVPLISTAAMGFVLAYVFGFAAHRLRLPPLVGYLVAGIAIGPFSPGFVADSALAGAARRDGRHPADVRRRPAFLGGGSAGGALDRRTWRDRSDRHRHRAWASDSPWPGAGCRRRARLRSLPFGRQHGRPAAGTRGSQPLATSRGRIAVGWLIVEDLVMVLTLVLLPVFAEALGGRTGLPAGEAAGGGTLSPSPSGSRCSRSRHSSSLRCCSAREWCHGC